MTFLSIYYICARAEEVGVGGGGLDNPVLAPINCPQE